jgi:hypothetical protein
MLLFLNLLRLGTQQTTRALGSSSNSNSSSGSRVRIRSSERPLRQAHLPRVVGPGHAEHHGHGAAEGEAVQRRGEHGMRVHVRRDAGTGRVVLHRELVRQVALHGEAREEVGCVSRHRREVSVRGAKGRVVEVVAEMLAQPLPAACPGVHGGFFRLGDEVMDQGQADIGPSLDSGVCKVGGWDRRCLYFVWCHQNYLLLDKFEHWTFHCEVPSLM